LENQLLLGVTFTNVAPAYLRDFARHRGVRTVLGHPSQT
jgi:hypothetical protein